VSRRRLRVRGQVQGVGFRPYVYRLATELGLAGWVRNDAQGVEIEVAGPAEAVARFEARLPTEAPSLAHLTSIEPVASGTAPLGTEFRILASGGGEMRAEAVPDTGTCPDCLRELFDPTDRRYRYPFINCTQCGPRYTLIRSLPYDRARTSMAEFAQCPACLTEYEQASSRRFHAEPNACPACGPHLAICDGEGAAIDCADVVAETVARLARGEILAIKGLGGFHLACDARHPAAVARLRERKNREEKPFAVMVANAASAGQFAELETDSVRLMELPERPVVLLRKRADCDAALPGIAPGLAWLGVMLPYTPLHALLFHEAAGRTAGLAWLDQAQPLALVMTSANPGGEPLVMDNDEALRRLSGIADAFVMHDRAIVSRCDDSVLRAVAGREPGRAGEQAKPRLQFIRRARGYTPSSIPLAKGGPSVLACGGFLKNTVCFTRGEQAFLSPHIGDLDNAATCAALEETVGHLMGLLDVVPALVAHDLHPDFHSSRFAADFAQARGLPLVAVQHHHAHIAAVMAEHWLEGEVLGLALDGVGLGSDGNSWGGELLRVSARSFQRLGFIRPLMLPGGDKAAREPWRLAASVMHELGRAEEIKHRFPHPAAKAMRMMLASGVHAPPTTSCGRWFDAAVGFAGIKDFAAYEGQAAMLYEGLAEAHGPVPPFAEGYAIGEDGQLDLLPLLARLAGEMESPGFAASLFHGTLALALADWVEWAAARTGLRRVALGGGCFLNHILSRELRTKLETRGLEVFEARLAPPNDGGLSLGQAWIALNRLLAKEM
jgi:hydrogenase maturation protein HypF